MNRSTIVAGLVLFAAVWWLAERPREEIACCIVGSMLIDPSTARVTDAVDRSADFANGLEVLPSSLPAYDDAVFLDGGKTALVTGHDGRIWRVDIATNSVRPIADVPLMAWGIHEVPGDPHHVYFCSAATYEDEPTGEAAGLYRLDMDTGTVEPLALKVPDTLIDRQGPVVYADGDSKAPELKADGSGWPSRAIVVCDNLEVSEDGRRIYFSEPFSYKDATLGDALDEAIALSPNGRLWRYDLDSGTTRLIAEGFHFINGIVYDLHPGKAREESVLVTQTSLFRVSRLYVGGPKAGTAEVAIDGLPGTPDGIDRDAQGRLWLAMFADRGRLLTWVHAHARLKPLVMRLPTRLLLSQAQRTGVVVLSPDGSTPLYSAFYQGPTLFSIASAVPAPSGIYLANVAFGKPDGTQQSGIQRLRWPAQFQETDSRPR